MYHFIITFSKAYLFGINMYVISTVCRGYSRHFLGPVNMVKGPENMKNLVFGRKISSF